MPHRRRRVRAVVGEPGEHRAQAHQRERGGKAEHDRHDDQPQHQEAEVAVGHMFPRRHHPEQTNDDQRHHGKSEPDPFFHLWSFSLAVMISSSLAMSSSLTCSNSFSFSTSTSSTSSSREGHFPSLRQITQRIISTMPCTSRNAPAPGMTVLN